MYFSVGVIQTSGRTLLCRLEKNTFFQSGFYARFSSASTSVRALIGSEMAVFLSMGVPKLEGGEGSLHI